MLTSLSIGNFKAFGEIQTIPIRPITLIFGANSSGKSSIIHSLLLARHALETGNWSVHRTAQGGDSMDLGGFGAYVHRHDLATPVTLGFGLSTAEDRLDTHLSLRVGTSVSLRLDIGSEVAKTLVTLLSEGLWLELRRDYSDKGTTFSIDPATDIFVIRGA
ncbi:MAG TPA: AAA family ATPase [Candidatus Paceibacterota bacterium]|nr:AAA family ATPase [Candidatus Paceibacterota bacterium]